MIDRNAILREIVLFFAPVAEATQPLAVAVPWHDYTNDTTAARPHDPTKAMVELLESAGLEVAADIADIRAGVDALVTAGEALWQVVEPLSKGQEPQIDPLVISAIKGAIDAFPVAMAGIDGMPPPDEILAALLEHLAARYLRDRAPTIWHAACLLGVTNAEALSKERRGQFDARAIWPALSDPTGQLKTTIAWETGLDADLLFDHLAGLAAQIGVDLSEIEAPAHDFAPPAADVDAADLRALSLTLPAVSPDANIVAVLAELPENGAEKPGLVSFVAATGSSSKTIDLGEGWQVVLATEFDATLPLGLVARPGLFELATLSPAVAVQAKAHLSIAPKDRTAQDIFALAPLSIASPPPVGRIEVQTGANETVRLEIALEEAEIRLEAGSADGFLSKLMPKPLATKVSLTAGYDVKTGFYLQRGGGLAVELPVGLSLGGVVTILAVGAALKAAKDTEVGQQILSLGLTGKAKLGPLGVTVEGLGTDLKGGLPTDLSSTDGLTAAFKRPTGLGLSLEAGPFSGGGYISHDPDKGQYVGALSLDIDQIGLSAFGILDTQMPDGGDGYSLLVTVAGRFAPIPLGFGFTLSGVGGLLGLHRDVDIAVLKQMVRAGTAGDILAPKDPVGDAPRIAREAGALFPVTRGQHVFGPTVKLGWGQPIELVSLDLALALTLPDPLRLILLGKVTAAIPDPKLPLFALNMNVFGVLDFTAKRLEAEGVLYDSRVQGLPVKGGFAVLTSWGAEPALAFSVGGLHPAFPRPSGFPEVERMGIDLSGRGVTLLLEGYFAITSNSLQLGARAALKAGAAGFNVEGELGFDALVIFEPFGVDLVVYASVVIKRGSTALVNASIKGRLQGPGPWVISGEASVEILFVDVPVSFSATIGAAQSTPLSTVNAGAILATELADARNWAGETAPGDAITDHMAGLVPPGAQLVFDQKRLPLDLPLETVGANPIEGARRFSITGLRLGADRLAAVETLRGPFAPGEFMKVSEKDRISGASYEDMPSGARFAEPAAASAPQGSKTVSIGRTCFVVHRDASTSPPLRRVRQSAFVPKRPDRVRRADSHEPQGRIGVLSERWVGTDETLGAGGAGGSQAEARAAGASTVARTSEVTP